PPPPLATPLPATPPPVATPIAKPRAPIAKPRVATQAPRLTQETPKAAAPTAVEVADLYGAVGRSLGQLQQAKGSDATIDLWPRFRHIRINDGIATPTARADTRRVLQHLKRDVDARR
ncbi:MAG: hypothetical protein H0V17_27165, partial [Deltaproteobacteria bacterium]|nr:hypothetical protein [Deltaproteobacteria bacterium]